MKVAFVTSDYFPKNIGGAGISSKLIVDGLRENSVFVDSFAINGSHKRGVQDHGDHYRLPAGDSYCTPNPLNGSFQIPNPIGENISSYKNLPSLDTYDIIHVYNSRHIPAAILRSSTPILSTINNFGWICADPERYLREGCPEYSVWDAWSYSGTAGHVGLKRILRVLFELGGKALVKRSNIISVQTNGMREILQNCGYDEQMIRVVPNIIDPSFKVEPTCSSKTILYVGRLRREKGVIDAIRAYCNLPTAVRDEWRFQIYGDGPQEEMVRQLVTQENDIDLDYCPYPELPDKYRNAELLIHPSKYPEPFSRTWLEAMASKTPILCSENPSSCSVLDSVAEFYDPFDLDDFTAKLTDLLEDPSRMEVMKAKGINLLSNYSADKVTSEYISVYKRIIQEGTDGIP